jgi:hypothetical protein
MRIFNVHSAVLAKYRDFVRSSFMIAGARGSGTERRSSLARANGATEPGVCRRTEG